MADYFQQFPVMLYSFNPAATDFYTVRNIFARVKLLDAVLDNTLVYYPYNMQDGDTPEMIAHKYYGDAKRHWLVMFANRIVDPYFDFALDQPDLENNIVLKYGSLTNAQATLHHVEQRITTTTNKAGNVNITYANTTLNSAFTYDFTLNQVQAQALPTINSPILPISNNSVTLADGTAVTMVTTLNAVSNYDYEVNQNEAKRQINLLDKSYVTAIESELKNLLST